MHEFVGQIADNASLRAQLYEPHEMPLKYFLNHQSITMFLLLLFYYCYIFLCILHFPLLFCCRFPFPSISSFTEHNERKMKPSTIANMCIHHALKFQFAIVYNCFTRKTCMVFTDDVDDDDDDALARARRLLSLFLFLFFCNYNKNSFIHHPFYFLFFVFCACTIRIGDQRS